MYILPLLRLSKINLILWIALNKIAYIFCCRPPLPVILPVASGQGLQISAQLVRRGGKIFYSLMLENNTETPLDGFMFQFNKNTFGLAAGGPLQVPVSG